MLLLLVFQSLLLSSRVSELFVVIVKSFRVVVKSFRVVVVIVKSCQEFQSCFLLSSRVSELFVVIVKSFRVVCCYRQEFQSCWLLLVVVVLVSLLLLVSFTFRRLFVVIVTDIVALVKRVNWWWWWWWCHCSRFIGCLLSLLTLSLSSGELFVVAVVIGGFRGGLLLSLLTLFLSRESNVCCWCRQRQAAVFSCKTEDGGAVACCCRSRRWTGFLQLSGSGGMTTYSNPTHVSIRAGTY